MRAFRGVAVALVVVALLGAGCGGSSAPVATVPLDEGTSIPPRRFLADSASAAAALRDFVDVLGEVGPVATPARLSAVADRLVEPGQRARLMVQRLGAGRLVDQRLEGERRRVAPALAAAVEAMDAVLAAARASDAQALAAATGRLAAAVEAVRRAGAPESR